MGSGRQWQSWISLDDEVSAIIHLLGSGISGPVNLTAPNPVRQRDFARALGRAVRRPAVLPIPGFAPKLALGAELVDNLLLTGQRVLPKALLADGFDFRHPTLDPALADLLR
jgi:NAD dependent epimerase/dehydratase family enzyme